MKSIFLNALVAASFLATLSAAAGTPVIEVVQSVPLETTLAVPGIRQAQEVWIEMIKGARTSLDIEQFYVSDQAGEALAPVIAEIQAAANRGVRVRLLADAKFDKTYPESVAQIGAFPNSESRVIDFAPYGGVQHAKFFVVDGTQAFVGSQNFDWRALSHIHEIGLRVADPKISSDLTVIFERDWASGTSIARGRSGSQSAPFAELLSDAGLNVLTPSAAPVTVVASPAQANPPGTPDSLSAITALMKSARKIIAIQVMEYSTSIYGHASTHWRPLDDAIRAAAARGVRVQLLVDVSDLKKAKADLKALAALPNIEVRSATIPAFSGGKIDFARLIHSKYLVIDDGAAAWVGSENWSMGYFMNTRDVGLLVSDSAVAAKLAQVFSRIWTSTYVSAL